MSVCLLYLCLSEAYAICILYLCLSAAYAFAIVCLFTFALKHFILQYYMHVHTGKCTFFSPLLTQWNNTHSHVDSKCALSLTFRHINVLSMSCPQHIPPHQPTWPPAKRRLLVCECDENGFLWWMAALIIYSRKRLNLTFVAWTEWEKVTFAGQNGQKYVCFIFQDVFTFEQHYRTNIRR